MTSCNVFVLDRANGVYYAGDTVSGCAQLTTVEEQQVKKICIVFQGQAKTQWSEDERIQCNNIAAVCVVNFKGSEKYIKSCNVVHGGGVLPSGLHTFSFSVVLPAECPSSCMEKHGSISYKLSLVVEPELGSNEVYEQSITVVRALNLNLRPDLLIPLETESIQRFCSWHCATGPLITTVTVPFGGYAPGQALKYSVDLNNKSKGRALKCGIKLELKQLYNFIAYYPSKKSREYVSVLTDKEQLVQLPARDNHQFEGELVLPSVPPTSEHFGAITVSYVLAVRIITDGSVLPRFLEIPIVVGTVPLAQSAIGWQPSKQVCKANDGHALPRGYENFEPSSYEQQYIYCGQITDTDENDSNRYTGFLPKYPMYTNFQIPPEANN